MASSEKVKAKIYLVRHGECLGNVQQLAMEPFDDMLTQVGKDQATLLGQCLKKVAFTRAYASDYPRTFETAQLILRQNEVSDERILKGEKRIRERDYTGILNQKASVAFNLLMDAMKQGTRYLDVQMPNSETVKQFEERLIVFFKELIQDLKKSPSNEENILLVSHGLTNQRLMVLLNQRPKEFGIESWTPNLFCEKLMRNTSFHKLGLEIPRDEKTSVTGEVEYPHYREHVTGKAVEMDPKVRDKEGVKDARNYTFLEERQSDLANFEEETTHYCKPV